MKSEQILPQKNINLIPHYTQNYGAVYLGDSQELIKFIQDNSINLIITSPPFALTRKKEYGNE
ncbi:MAG: site-specific DNA-methyltransferase, partial [Fischerella sp.]|nr:site-specific DNA-methyltransferase [Fischerella sp.]